MDRPLVSVVVVCWNDWPDVEHAIDSALAQTWPNLEVVVIDNGSTDATASELPRRFAGRIQYHRQENRGAAGGRNAGLARCRGEFIQFLDGDDLLAPTKIARQVEFLLAHPEFGVAAGRFRCFRSTPDVSAALLFDRDPPNLEDAKAALLKGSFCPPICFLLRRAVVDAVGPMDERLRRTEDLDYWLRVAFAGFRFGATPEAWSFYRRRAGQKTADRLAMALGDYACFAKALRYVRDEPHRSQLLERLARLTHSLGHCYLHRGDARRARKLLRRSAAWWPARGARPPKRWAEWLAAAPGGPALYRAARRLRGLPPPFAHDPGASLALHRQG